MLLNKLGVVLAASAMLAPGVLDSAGQAAVAANSDPFPTQRVCADPQPGAAACHAILRTDTPAQQLPPAGYGPADLRAAYRFPVAGGAGRTVAVVTAYDLPAAESDLAVYRAQFGLSPCTTANGCFRKVNQNGGATPPRSDAAWGLQSVLDLDLVSAVCPDCRILLVEADGDLLSQLGAGVNTAVSLGAQYVTNSYGAPEFPGETAYNHFYDHPGVAVAVSSGGSGMGAQYPAASPFVTAVGGTRLFRQSNSRGWFEEVWSGAGAGCSAYEAKPRWQTDDGCARRTIADVSAVADPATPVAAYHSTPFAGRSGWSAFGGTNVSASIIAAAYALAGTPPAGSYPAGIPYAKRTGFYDIVFGNTGSCARAYLCTGSIGYDGPSGVGTPSGTSGLAAAYDPIEQHYLALGGAGSFLGNPVGSQYGVPGGSAQDYQGGTIYYSTATGAWAVRGAILSRFQVLGGTGGVLGFPLTDERTTPDGVGRYNHFAREGSSIYWTPDTGARSIRGAIRTKWASLGWERSALGYPATDELPTPDGIGRYNHFAGSGGSSIYWTPDGGAWSVQGAIRAKWASLGWELGRLGYPVSDEFGIPGGRCSAFQHGFVTWNASNGAIQVNYQ